MKQTREMNGRRGWKEDKKRGGGREGEVKTGEKVGR